MATLNVGQIWPIISTSAHLQTRTLSSLEVQEFKNGGSAIKGGHTEIYNVRWKVALLYIDLLNIFSC